MTVGKLGTIWAQACPPYPIDHTLRPYLHRVQVIYDAMLQKEYPRPGLSVLTVSLETYHEQIKAAKQSQTLLLGTIDDILTGRLLVVCSKPCCRHRCTYIQHALVITERLASMQVLRT